MAIDLADYETKARVAVKYFWRNRQKSSLKQIEHGIRDQGERASVTAGKNMDGFIDLINDLVIANRLTHANIHRKRRVVTLPGFFRSTKQWDVVVTDHG